MTEDIFHDWTDKEIAAMHRATYKLRAIQPPDNPPLTNDNSQGCYYDPRTRSYRVYTMINQKMVFCGQMREWDKNRAYIMQKEINIKYYEKHSR